jgi:CHAD domain-containing protein
MARQKSVSIKPKQTVEDAFEQILRTDLESVYQWTPVALAGKDVEGVHQMRVALRRMRSALTVFRPAIPRKITAPLARKMRWAALQLDRARDLDVYIEDNLSGRKLRPSERKIRKIALQHRKVTYDQVRDFIHGKRFNALERNLSKWLDSRGWQKQLQGKRKKMVRGRVGPFAAGVLESHRAQILEHGKGIQNLDNEALHQLRIDCKKLRYATEFFSPLYGKHMATFTSHLKGLQDLLGTLHDCVVMSGLQKDLLKGKNNPKLNRLSGKLEARRMREACDLKKILKGRWNAFAQAKRPWRASLA